MFQDKLSQNYFAGVNKDEDEDKQYNVILFYKNKYILKKQEKFY